METAITAGTSSIPAMFDDILSDIENESCVLIVGPDIVNYGDKSCFETLCEELLKDTSYSQLIDLTPQYVFSHEELLQLKPAAKETSLLRYMERFYQRQTQYDEPFKKIARIPFHLVVSFLPDTRLRKIYEEQGCDFRYSHYPREENPEPVERPTRKTPLVYNILGDFSEGDVIITFDHLFQYLSGIMGKRELPHAIQEAFKKARTFVFLGVHFERWYVQLILRIITTKEKKEKYSILRNGNGSDVYTFIARRLELDFVETDPVDFLNKLYDACEANKLLKTSKKQTATGRVFISYSHKDIDTVEKIEEHLKQSAVDVMRDESDMAAGQQIDEFISTINSVDVVVAVLSASSLRSPWVIKEIITTIQQTDRLLLPCYLDDSFLDENFMSDAEKFVDEKLSTIAEKIMQRGRSKTDDLFKERNTWTEYFNNLPIVLNEVQSRKCLSLKTENFEDSIVKVVECIRNYKIKK